MIGQDIGCEWGDADGDQFFSKRVLSPLASGMQRLFFEKPVTSLIIFVCWYSLIEVPLEFGMGNDNAMLPAAVVARLIVIVEGLGRCHGCPLARVIFVVLRGTSVLAIEPVLRLGSEIQLWLCSSHRSHTRLVTPGWVDSRMPSC
ncbi:hypothetical protein [Paraburkholderia sp. BL25I1N1]|uniref:hypothetical protein n=1 Tax=Paraburkholderia sp. BL25I1N1 TaxID=1938804 RepID=UPI000D4245AC|nr:hypothetical protein [Paraburkholderia sp. BL25I1N1]PRX97562.1 hypothetical protein B0G73_12723 [Paraburkholderia sp. BL25I1N1]